MSNYIAWSKDSDNLQKSSSGGIFFEMAKKTLQHNGAIVGVIINNRKVYYRFTRFMSVVKRMRGSKYIKADLSKYVIKQMQQFKGKILFVGLPCQLKMVKKIFNDRDNILYIEVRCYGVIKKDIFNKHIDKICLERNNYVIDDIKFRDKSSGWENSTVLHIDFDNFETYHRKDELIEDFLRKKNLESRCKICTSMGYGDIILGDYWECPEKYKNKSGTSKVLTITDKGFKFFESIKNIHSYKFNNHPLNHNTHINKVAIIRGADFTNNGNLLMTQNFISYLSKIVKDVKFVVIDPSRNKSVKEHLEKVLSGLNIDIDYRYYSEWEWLNKEKLIGYVKGKSKIEKTLYDCDTVIYLAGDTFLGKGKWFIWLFTCLDLIRLKNAGKRVYLVSQTLGEFPKYIKHIIKIKSLIKHAFNKLDGIYCRDTFSVNELRKLGVTDNVSLSSDLAFLPLHLEKELKEINKGKGKSFNYTTFTISDTWSVYSETESEFLNKICKILKGMCVITGLPVYVLSHSCTNSEYYMLEKIRKLVSDNDVNIKFLPKSYPVESRILFGHSKLNVSLRMHSSLSSIQQNVPVIPIAYSSKYNALYSDLKLDELVVDKLDVKEVLYKVEYVWGMKDYYPNKIRLMLKSTKKGAIRPILEIAREIVRNV